MARTLRFSLLATLFLAVTPLRAQRRPRRPPPRTQTVVDASAPPSPAVPAAPELVSVPVALADTHLRQMRVYLFTPPSGATGYGLGQLGPGVARVWALLPSCRPPSPDDPRDPCPIDRVILEGEGNEGRVYTMDPQGIAPGADARRVQSFSVPAGVRRVRIKVMGPQARVRYEAMVDVERLVDLPAPQGTSTPAGFAFDLARYPAR
jgi:hypothetical protein